MSKLDFTAVSSLINGTTAKIVSLGMGGRIAGEIERPLRKTPTGFGVVVNGKVRNIAVAEGRITVDLVAGDTFAPSECPAAKLADLGLSKAKPSVAAPASPAAAMLSGMVGAKRERTPAQRQATLSLCEKNLAKARATGDAGKIGKAEKAVATAKANLVAGMVPASPAADTVRADAANPASVAQALVESGVDLKALMVQLAHKIA